MAGNPHRRSARNLPPGAGRLSAADEHEGGEGKTAGRTLGMVSLGIAAAALVAGAVLLLLGTLLLLALGLGLFVWWAGLWAVAALFGTAFLVGLAGVIVSTPRRRRGGLPLAAAAAAVNAAALAAALFGALSLGRELFGGGH